MTLHFQVKLNRRLSKAPKGILTPKSSNVVIQFFIICYTHDSFLPCAQSNLFILARRMSQNITCRHKLRFKVSTETLCPLQQMNVTTVFKLCTYIILHNKGQTSKVPIKQYQKAKQIFKCRGTLRYL